MSVKIISWISILMGICAVTLLGIFTVRRDQEQKSRFAPQQAIAYRQYRDPEFSFTFYYPQSLNVFQTSTDHLTVGTKSGEMIIPFADIHIRKSGDHIPKDEFIVEQMKDMCITMDHQNSITCETVDSVRTLHTTGEQKGYVLYLAQEMRGSQDDMLHNSRFGPLFAIPLSDQEQHVVFMTPSQSVSDPRVGDILRVMFESVATASAL